MNRRRREAKIPILLALAAAALAWAASPAAASTFVAVTTEDLVRTSASIVEGEVLAVQSRWTADGRIIVTDATVRVSSTLAGEAAPVVRVKTFGGTVGGFTVEAHGFPTFRAGERVLLFLEPDTEAGRLRVNGYQQGHYRVVGGPGAETALSTVDDGARLIAAPGARAESLRALPLTELRQRIRAEVQRLQALER